MISTTLVGDSPATLRLTWTTKPRARADLEDELFGKRILFSDKDRARRAVIVADYRSQSEVEGDFRQLKDPHVVSFSPMFHWTDHKIRVHTFYCVLALTVARLMVREAVQAGMHLSVRELLDTLSDIQETVLLYQGERGRPRARRMLTEMTPTARRAAGASSPRLNVSVRPCNIVNEPRSLSRGRLRASQRPGRRRPSSPPSGVRPGHADSQAGKLTGRDQTIANPVVILRTVQPDLLLLGPGPSFPTNSGAGQRVRGVTPELPSPLRVWTPDTLPREVRHGTTPSRWGTGSL